MLSPQSTLLVSKMQRPLSKQLKKLSKRSKMPSLMKEAGKMQKNKRKSNWMQRRSGGTFKTQLSSTFQTSFAFGVTLTLTRQKTFRKWSKLLML